MALVLVTAGAAPLAARQVPAPSTPAPRDSARAAAPPDSAAPADSLAARRAPAADSLLPDSTSPVLPPLGPPGSPQPAGRRWIFDRDALRWSGAQTLGELLRLVPGVYLVRAGWYGQPEMVAYAGQGSVAVELYWDGFQLDPVGYDSAGFDIGRFDLGQYQRVEVEVLPTTLRVNLVSDAQAVQRARTETSFSSGDGSTNSYRLRYLNRWASGAGLNLGFVYLGSSGPSNSLGKVAAFQVNVKGTWMASDLVGVEAQLSSSNIQRATLQPPAATTPLQGIDARRSDLFVHAFAATRRDGLGLRADAIMGRTAFHDTTGTLDASVGQASLTVGYRAARWSAEAWSRARDDNNPLDFGLRGSWSPLRPLVLTSYLRDRGRLGGGGQRELATAFSLHAAGPATLHGDLRWRQAADTGYTAADSTETVTDWSAGVVLAGRLASLDVSYGVRGAFTAPALGLFSAQIPGVRTVAGNAVTVTWQLRPRRWLTLSGWIRAPSSDSIPFDPPTHSVTRLTFRSAFLPHFRRNAFDLMAQVEMEAWGGGLAGYDASGNAVPLHGKAIFNLSLAFRLVGAQIYWIMANSQREVHADLPGFSLARAQQRFGIRWEFTN